MSKPYYQDEYATIYHGDCREILPTLPPVGLVLTDPPYGTGWLRGGGKRAGEFHAQQEKPEWDVWSTDWIQLCRCPVAFFAPYSRKEEVEQIATSLLWWHKTNPRPLGPTREPIGIIGLEVQGEFSSYNGDTPFHPCQKPVPLLRWILGKCGVVSTVIDPFMGSGSTLRAAKDLGIKSIGIEIEEKYCEIAANRLAQNVLNFEATA